MMPPTCRLRKCTDGYKFTKWLEMIHHLMYMDDVNLFAEDEKNRRL